MATRAKKANTKSPYRNKFKTEWSAELTRSASIHYVILLHKYIELPILYIYFGIFYCESEIKYSENVYSKIMSHGQKRPQNSSDCSICNLDFKKFRGSLPVPPRFARQPILSPQHLPPSSYSGRYIYRFMPFPI